MKNIDKIRNMSNLELTKFIVNLQHKATTYDDDLIDALEVENNLLDRVYTQNEMMKDTLSWLYKTFEE